MRQSMPKPPKGGAEVHQFWRFSVGAVVRVCDKSWKAANYTFRVFTTVGPARNPQDLPFGWQ